MSKKQLRNHTFTFMNTLQNKIHHIKRMHDISSNQGFTAIEMLMAMAVFSFLLTLSVVGFIQINQIYQQGIAGQKTQDAARLIAEDISRAGRDSRYITVNDSGSNPVLCTRDHKYAIDGDHIYKQRFQGEEDREVCHNDAILASGIDHSVAEQLTDSELKVLDFGVEPFSQLDDGSGYRSAQITIRIGTANTDDLMDEGQCDPAATGSHFCAVSTHVNVFTTREAGREATL